jgi:hypothetical protein
MKKKKKDVVWQFYQRALGSVCLERKEREKDRKKKNVVWLKRWRKEKCV